MKSVRREAKIYNPNKGMSCEGCVFAELDEVSSRQSGCKAGRLEKLIEQGANKNAEAEYFNIPRLCNMYRDTHWFSQLPDGSDGLSEARHESMPLFGIAIHDHPDSTLEDLKKTVESIKLIDYPKDKIKIIVSTFLQRGVTNVVEIINDLKENGFAHSESIFHSLHIPRVKDTEVFKRLTLAHYFVSVYCGSEVRPNAFNIVDDSLNTKMDKVYLFNGDGYSIVSKAIIRKIYLDFNNYDAAIDYLISKNLHQDI